MHVFRTLRDRLFGARTPSPQPLTESPAEPVSPPLGGDEGSTTVAGPDVAPPDIAPSDVSSQEAVRPDDAAREDAEDALTAEPLTDERLTERPSDASAAASLEPPPPDAAPEEQDGTEEVVVEEAVTEGATDSTGAPAASGETATPPTPPSVETDAEALRVATDMSLIDRQRWAEERLLEDERVRGDLTDDEFQPLLDWALEAVDRLVSVSGDPNDRAVSLTAELGTVRDVLLAAGDAVTAQNEGDLERRNAALNDLERRVGALVAAVEDRVGTQAALQRLGAEVGDVTSGVTFSEQIASVLRAVPVAEEPSEAEASEDRPAEVRLLTCQTPATTSEPDTAELEPSAGVLPETEDDESSAGEVIVERLPSPEQTVNEPVASEPVASEPVASEPVASEPVASEPVASEEPSREPKIAERAARQPAPIERAVPDASPSAVGEAVEEPRSAPPARSGPDASTPPEQSAPAQATRPTSGHPAEDAASAAERPAAEAALRSHEPPSRQEHLPAQKPPKQQRTEPKGKRSRRRRRR